MVLVAFLGRCSQIKEPGILKQGGKNKDKIKITGKDPRGKAIAVGRELGLRAQDRVTPAPGSLSCSRAEPVPGRSHKLLPTWSFASFAR